MVAGYISGAWITQLITVFNVIKDGMLAYLAIFTGINAAKEFGATPGLGGVIGGTTLLTGIAKYFNECLHWRTIATWTRWNYWRYFCRLDFKYCRKEIA